MDVTPRPPEWIAILVAVFLAIWLFLMPQSPVQGQEIAVQSAVLALNSVDQQSIVLYEAVWGQMQRLTVGKGKQLAWGFSSDGCRLLATLNGKPVTININGGGASPLFDSEVHASLLGESWFVDELSWSSDGEQVAMVLARTTTRGNVTTQTHHIAVANITTGTLTLYSQTGREFSPQWSPDGAWLAYISYDERVAGADVFSTAVPTPTLPAGVTPPPVTVLNEADLWVTSADNSVKYRLTSFNTGNVTMPRWSTDSQLVSFVYSPSPSDDMFWMIANEQGAIPTQLSYAYVLAMDSTWTPDSSRIIGVARGLRGVEENRLWAIPLVGRADQDATLYLPNADLSHADYPRFSPDGRFLAVRTAYALAIVDVISGETRLLEDTWAMGNTPPLWANRACEG